MIFEDLRNNIDFYIRSKTKFSRKGFVERNNSILEHVFLENLYMKDILNKCFETSSKNIIKTLDIGCKNWFYAKGQYEYYSDIANTVFMDGVELDAYRLYSNFYTRYEVAKFYTKDLKNTNYIADNLLNLNNKYDYITWILPFVVTEPLEYWGLPKKYFCPERLLSHAYSLLNEKGQMLIINQGEQEALAQKKLLSKLNIEYIELGEIFSEYFEYKNKRYAYLIKKTKKAF